MRTNYLNDVKIKQTGAPNTGVLVTEVFNQQLSLVLGYKIDSWPLGSGPALNVRLWLLRLSQVKEQRNRKCGASPLGLTCRKRL